MKNCQRHSTGGTDVVTRCVRMQIRHLHQPCIRLVCSGTMMLQMSESLSFETCLIRSKVTTGNTFLVAQDEAITRQGYSQNRQSKRTHRQTGRRTDKTVLTHTTFWLNIACNKSVLITIFLVMQGCPTNLNYIVSTSSSSSTPTTGQNNSPASRYCTSLPLFYWQTDRQTHCVINSWLKLGQSFP